MASQYTRRFIVVVRADMAAAANNAANHATWDGGGAGDRTFTVGLSASGNAPAQAYWANTALTNAQATAVRNRLQNAGATVAETQPIVPGQTPASNKFAVFNATEGDPDIWTPEQVLTACGLQRIGGRP